MVGVVGVAGVVGVVVLLMGLLEVVWLSTIVRLAFVSFLYEQLHSYTTYHSFTYNPNNHLFALTTTTNHNQPQPTTHIHFRPLTTTSNHNRPLTTAQRNDASTSGEFLPQEGSVVGAVWS